MTEPHVARRPGPSLGPTSESERLDYLDAMRGVAILGVLVAYTVWNLGAPPVERWSRLDHVVERATDLLVDNKFLTLFACLFGLGVSQQWQRWESAGRNPLPLHLRRMGFLLAAGLAHAVLLRNGDILAPYALLGLVLPGFRHASNRAVAIAAVALALTPFAVFAVMSATGLRWPPRPTDVTGGYFVENLAWLRHWYVTNPLRSWPQVLALMLAGLLVGRGRVLERLAADRGRAVRVLLAALALALATRFGLERLQALWAGRPMAMAQRMSLSLLFELSSWTLSAAYGVGLVLLTRSAGWTRRIWPLRAVGRMAFTNYLLQALIVVPVCLAFGLFDRMSPSRAVALAAGIALFQLVASSWWLGRHAMGPLERLWRAVTYGSDPEGSRVTPRGALSS